MQFRILFNVVQQMNFSLPRFLQLGFSFVYDRMCVCVYDGDDNDIMMTMIIITVMIMITMMTAMIKIIRVILLKVITMRGR